MNVGESLRGLLADAFGVKTGQGCGLIGGGGVVCVSVE